MPRRREETTAEVAELLTRKMRRGPRVWRWGGWVTTRTCNTRATHCRGEAGRGRRRQSPSSPSWKQTDGVAQGDNALAGVRGARWRHWVM